MKDNKPEGKSESGDEQERIAKRMARAGLCSRREAEKWIEAGRVTVNGECLTTPAFTVGPKDEITVDGKPLQAKERTRLWLYHKPSGLVTTNRDPEGRRTVFDALPANLPRVISVGRLDISTEGLLLLTNDGGLARVLELPDTGWLRRYRARAHGQVTQEALDRLKDGIAVNGVLYGPIEALIDREQGSNTWLTVAFREGKNREVKEVLGSLGFEVTRLIRISYGPFRLGDMPVGSVREIRGRTLRDQLGEKLIAESGADFDAPILHQASSIARKASQVKKPKLKKRIARGQARQEALDRLGTEEMNPQRSQRTKPTSKKAKSGSRTANRKGNPRADNRR